MFVEVNDTKTPKLYAATRERILNINTREFLQRGIFTSQKLQNALSILLALFDEPHRIDTPSLYPDAD
jgi:hypothetical protein